MICPNCGRELHEQQILGLRFIPPCTCQEEAERMLRQEEILRGTGNLAAAYLRLSGVSKRYRTADLRSIQPRNGQERALEACRELAENLEDGTGLLLVGGVGSGKTLFSSATAVRMCKKQAEGAREDFKRNFARVTDTLDYLLRPWVQMVSTVALFSQMKACFDGAGRWVKTEWDVRLSELPDAVRTAIVGSQYASYRVDDIEYVQASGTEYYRIELERGDSEATLRVDAGGNIL